MPNNGVAWMVKGRLRQLSPSEQHALALWLEACENRRQYLRAEVVWRLLGSLSEERLHAASSA